LDKIEEKIMNFDDWWNFGWMNDVGYYVADLG